MVVGLLQFDLVIHDAMSIKDKRRVVSSLKDRLHREHLVSIAEVGDPDLLNHARLAVAVVARDGRRAGQVLDHVSEKLRSLHDAEAGPMTRHIIHAQELPEEAEEEPSLDPDPDGSIAEEMLRRATQENGTTPP